MVEVAAALVLLEPMLFREAEEMAVMAEQGFAQQLLVNVFSTLAEVGAVH
jgi:hypothetical protein